MIQEYLRCYRLPGTVHAICEDYRAAATIDLDHDAADVERRVTIPLLALRGANAAILEWQVMHRRRKRQSARLGNRFAGCR